MPQYEVIVWLEGEDAEEALSAYRHGGGREVLDVLTDHDEGQVSKVSDVSRAGEDDETMQIGDYLVIVNPEAGTAGLEVVS